MDSFANEAVTLAVIKAQIATAITELTSTNAAKMQYVSECKTSSETSASKTKALQDKIAGR